VRPSWCSIPVQQGLGTHEYAGETVTALAGLLLENAVEQRMIAIIPGKRLHGLHVLATDGADGNHAGCLRSAVDQHGAAHALALDATSPRALQSEVIAQNIQKRRIRVDVNVERLPVDVQPDRIH